jgi:hypothetical protein
MKKIFLALLFLPFFSACFIYNYAHYRKRDIKTTAEPISHAIWDTLLQKNVDTLGNVDYQAFIKDSVRLRAYIDTLAAHHPNEKTWQKNERLAYWINAYNAYTVLLIVRHYPIKSIKDIERKAINIPFGNTVWDIEFINIEQQIYSLNYLEHKILRKEFDEPRIHFAINCASYSCPALRAEAYTATKLAEQLDQQARLFLSDPRKNVIISAEKAQLSKIFSWFAADFRDKSKKGKKQNLIDFINLYAPISLQPKAQIDYLEYNWSLNES